MILLLLMKKSVQKLEENGLISFRLSVTGADVTLPFTPTIFESIQVFATAILRDSGTSKSFMCYNDGEKCFAFDPTKFAQLSAS